MNPRSGHGSNCLLYTSQPHSGSSANLAAYMSVLKPGDTILAMILNNGGHLTHGSPVNFSGKLFHMEFYGVDENGFIDYEDVRRKARECRPQLIPVSYTHLDVYKRQGAAISLVMMIIVLVCMLVMNRFGEGEEQAVML